MRSKSIIIIIVIVGRWAEEMREPNEESMKDRLRGRKDYYLFYYFDNSCLAWVQCQGLTDDGDDDGEVDDDDDEDVGKDGRLYWWVGIKKRGWESQTLQITN